MSDLAKRELANLINNQEHHHNEQVCIYLFFIFQIESQVLLGWILTTFLFFLEEGEASYLWEKRETKQLHENCVRRSSIYFWHYYYYYFLHLLRILGSV